MKKLNYKSLLIFLVTITTIVVMIFSYTNSIKNNLVLGLDLQGGFEILYEVSPLNDSETLPSMDVVATSVSKRVNVLGVSEPQIIIEGDNRIRVQLAGVLDQEGARNIISSTASLSFRDVNDKLLADASIIEEGGASLGFVNGAPVVSLKIADKQAFKQLTQLLSLQPNGQNLIVTWLDYQEGDSYYQELQNQNNGIEPKFISVAGVSSAIDGDATISGNFTEEEALELATLISSGSLPVKMTELSSNAVSAEFGVFAFEETMFAGVCGIIIIMLFMIFTYRLPGIIASIMLCFYIFTIFFIYSGIGAVFTLTGIAALVLGVGMTLDANIISFERIREELINDNDIKTACKLGQQNSFLTILDAQLTTLLAGIIMYVLGTGSVKGFATMLIISVICTLLINVVLSRFLLNTIINTNLFNNHKFYNVKANKKQSKLRYQDFIKNSKYQIIASLSIVVLSILMMGYNHFNSGNALNLGIDFSSGTKISVITNDSMTLDQVTNEFIALGYDDLEYQQSGENIVNVTINEALSKEKISDISEVFKGKFDVTINDSVVTPVVGRDLVKNAIMLSLIAWVCMLIYVTFRFKWDYALSCILALVHDVVLILSFFAILRLEINVELVSVVLAIIGYSINNSIVVFDRVREIIKKLDHPIIDYNEYKIILNQAIGNTLTRSIYSSLTTILPVIVLLFIGSDSILIFNIALFIGLVIGTLSSIYVSPYIFYRLRIKNHNKPVKVKKSDEPEELEIKGINS